MTRYERAVKLICNCISSGCLPFCRVNNKIRILTRRVIKALHRQELFITLKLIISNLFPSAKKICHVQEINDSEYERDG